MDLVTMAMGSVSVVSVGMESQTVPAAAMQVGPTRVEPDREAA
jgi:hypothetical protein